MREIVPSLLGRGAGAVLLGAAVLVSTGVAREYRDGKRFYDEAMRRKSEGDPAAAVAGFEDAARAYFPGSPYPRKALRELEILAKGAEMRGETGRAATIQEATRRAILSTRHIVQPHTEQLEKAEKAIRRLAGGATEVPEPLKDRMTARPEDPSPLFSITLFLGLLAWVGGALALFLGLPRDRSGRPRGRGGAALVCLAGLLVWLSSAWLSG